MKRWLAYDRGFRGVFQIVVGCRVGKSEDPILLTTNRGRMQAEGMFRSAGYCRVKYRPLQSENLPSNRTPPIYQRCSLSGESFKSRTPVMSSLTTTEAQPDHGPSAPSEVWRGTTLMDTKTP